MNDTENIETVQTTPQPVQPRDEDASRRRFLPVLVVKNAAALYGVQAGRKLIPLASIPYLARVLGPEGWGQVAFVSALAELIVILIEFGFSLSATRSVARHRDDPYEQGRIAMGVICAQIMLATLGLTLALVASRFIPLLRNHPALLAAGLGYAVAQGFVPLWYFQGTEQIRLAAVIEIGAKAIGLAALFIFVHNPQDAWRALAIQALSPVASVVVGLRLACANVYGQPEWQLVRTVLKEGWHMFVFRSAESIYGVANAFLLGLFAPAAMVGYFGAAEKISKAAAGLVNPVRESLYPRINHLVHREKPEAMRLARIGLTAMLAIGLTLSVVLFFFAGPLIGMLMGARFEPAVKVLRILSPLPFALATTFACGQLYLLPLRRDATVLHVVFFAAAVNLAGSFILGPRWGHIGMAVTVLISETIVASSLAWNVLRLRKTL
ncbi:MAG: flippase [Acidobacteriota bacterium]|nr:flippase [Acidobacteriota bacterium]